MPIDKALIDPTLDVYRNMARDVQARGLKGADVDQMNALLGRMESLAREMNDIVSYMTRMATEQYFAQFGAAYSRAVSAASKAAQPTDDAGLLRQSLEGYEASYRQLAADPNMQHLAAPLRRALEIGRSGVSYPVFLRMCEEQGLFEKMKNGDLKPTLDFDLHCAQVMGDPVRVEMCTKILQTYEALSSHNAFGLADNVQFEIARKRIEWQYAPRLAEWKSIIEHWQKLHEMVFDWLDAHCEFAVRDARWSDQTPELTWTNIQRTRETIPGQLVVREGFLREYHGLTWYTVWVHPTYLAEQQACRIFDSDERLELVRRTYPVCKLGQTPAADVIQKNEQLVRANAIRSPRHAQRFGDAARPGPGYDFVAFSEFVKKRTGSFAG